MSSGKLDEDRVSFEVNSGGKVSACFSIQRVFVKDAPNDERILIRFSTRSTNDSTNIQNINQILIPKDRTMVLSHILRKMADTVEEHWYKNNKGV